MRNWPPKMEHLLMDSAPAAGETWESMLQRLADKTQQANTAATLIDALSTPMNTSPEPVHKARRISNTRSDNQSTTLSESVELPPTPSNPANRLDLWAFTDIGPLTCRACNDQYFFTAGEQAFYKSKGFEDQPKACKKCRNLAKADKPESSTTSTSTSGGWGSGSAPANAKDTWTSSGRTWPPTAAQLPKKSDK